MKSSRIPKEYRKYLEQNKQEYLELPAKFNVIKEDENIDYVSSRRVEITKHWIPKLLKYSVYLNILTTVFVIISLLFLITKPEPEFYVTTPNGTVNPIKTVKIIKTNDGYRIAN